MGQGFRIGLALACTTLALTLPAQAAGGAGCANRNASSGSAPLPEMRTAVVCLINEQRIERGLPALSVSKKLNRVAQRWTGSMVSQHQFSHAHFVSRIDAAHYDWQVAEENIATGYLTPSQTVKAWMASPDHCRNILDPTIRNVGSGELPVPVRGWASGPSTWTQDFGLKMGQSAPSRNFGPAGRCPYR
jgi:uncharacterized protein YkwD